MKDEGWRLKIEGWRMKDDFKLLGGFALWLTDEGTDIFNCRVAFVTEKTKSLKSHDKLS